MRRSGVRMVAKGSHRHGALRALLVVGLCLGTPGGASGVHAADGVPGKGCELKSRSAPRAVVRVIDGATLALDDGTHVRLIGALAPEALDAAPAPASRSVADEDQGPGGTTRDVEQERASGELARAETTRTARSDQPSAARSAPRDTWQPAVAARAALARLVEGGSVTFATSGRPRDRYGRTLAHVFAATADGGSVWLQGAMLAAGHARAYGIPDNFGCMDALLAAEAPAREAQRGLWANPAYAIRQARHTRALVRLRGTYQVVAGEVLKAQRVRSGWIHLNFGEDWRRDFSVSIAPGVSRANPAWAASLLGLQGRQVRVRGWIGRRNGPSVEIEHPGQIEILETDAAQGWRSPPDTVMRQ